MKFDGKLFLFGIPLVAIVAIALLQAKYGGLAPAPPVSIPDRTAQRIVPQIREPEATVLAPSAESNPLPPGTSPTSSLETGASANSDSNTEPTIDQEFDLSDPIPIPALQPMSNNPQIPELEPMLKLQPPSNPRLE